MSVRALNSPTAFGALLLFIACASAPRVEESSDRVSDADRDDSTWVPPPPRVVVPPMPALPRVEEKRLANGLTVYTHQAGDWRLAQVVVVMRGGSAADPVGKAGLVALLHRLLPYTNRTQRPDQVSQRLQELGASLQIVVEPDFSRIELVGPARHLDAMAQLLGQLVIDHAPLRADFARVHAGVLAALEADTDPSSLAHHYLLDRSFGTEHPYGHAPSGSYASLSRVVFEDVAEIAASLLRADAAAVIAISPSSHEVTSSVIARAFGRWRRGRGPTPTLTLPPASEASVTIIHSPELTQTGVLIAQNIPSSPSNGHAEVALFSQLLGGGMSSLLARLRDRSGYTYGVHADTRLLKHGAHFLVASNVDPTQVETALVEILQVLRDASTAAPSAEERDRARLRLRNDPRFRLESPSDLVPQLSWAFISEETLGAMRARHLDARELSAQWAPKVESAAVVLLGDASALRPVVLRLGLPTPVVVGD